MCPDKEILSIYYDGELEEPWKANVVEHLEECAHCREIMETFSYLTGFLHEPFDVTESMEAVRAKIEHPDNVIPMKKTPFWKRRVQIPLPIAGIAAALLITVGNFFAFNFSGAVPVTVAEAKPIETPQLVVSQEDELATLIKLMENEDFNNEVVIQLPEEGRFSVSGEPHVVRVKNVKRSY